MDEHVMRVLEMLQDGKITAEQAEALIAALNSHPSPSANPSPASTPASASESSPSSFKTDAARDSTSSSTGTSNTETGQKPSVDPATARLAAGDLLLLIAEDPSIPEDEKITLIIHATALICTVLALQPIPGVDIFILTPVQVASVMAMSHVLGEPLGKNGAGEIVASIIAVVGWGVLAEQFVLAGAKLLLPVFGGIALLPLIYAAVYGLGAAARAVLEARRRNQRLSDAEIRQIKEEAERRAKAQKRDWSLGALKRELDDWWARAETFKKFEISYTAAQRRYIALQEQMEPQSQRFGILTQRKMDLLQQIRLQEAKTRIDSALSDAERADLPEVSARLTTELANAESEWARLGAELDRINQETAAAVRELQALVRDRFRACYPGLRYSDQAIQALVLLPYEQLHSAERQIALIQFDPAKADYRGETFYDGSGKPIRMVGFGSEGCLYFETDGADVALQRVGSRRTADKDRENLRSAAAPRFEF